MPTPQENALVVEQASCLFWRMVQDVRCYRLQKLTNLSIPVKLQAQPQQCENSGNG
ncbi:hypothetical protein [Microcoleus vaginatus]|uniref:hypothetical protein n=1 Tax=Microcoleus vaginatus TaxID=119532 RepID=UPI001F61BF7D